MEKCADAPPSLTERSSGRSDRNDERPLTVWVSKAMHRQIKLTAAKEEVTIKALVSDALVELLRKLQGP
jgi:hypothetical protein